MLRVTRSVILTLAGLSLFSGCSLVPDVRCDPQVHNPFPQLKRVAVLPFFNQSNEPTLNQDEVAAAYYAELQEIPGFEVLPIGVTKLKWHEFVQAKGEPTGGAGFQEFARYLDVDAVVVGGVTDFTPYYPPRMAMTVRWYAANPGFHPIPPGYGLPWGTSEEKHIPRDVVLETEFELARSQLATQAPAIASDGQAPASDGMSVYDAQGVLPGEASVAEMAAMGVGACNREFVEGHYDPAMDSLPMNWPDPTGLIPDAPRVTAPPMLAQTKPVLSHTRIYDGKDSTFTQRLSDRFYADDDARFGGWQSYLSRSTDFIRFCCHLHITDMLSARGGKHSSDLILRWPVSRYSR